jgi:hypothetical protein
MYISQKNWVFNWIPLNWSGPAPAMSLPLLAVHVLGAPHLCGRASVVAGPVAPPRPALLQPAPHLPAAPLPLRASGAFPAAPLVTPVCTHAGRSSLGKSRAASPSSSWPLAVPLCRCTAAAPSVSVVLAPRPSLRLCSSSTPGPLPYLAQCLPICGAPHFSSPALRLLCEHASFSPPRRASALACPPAPPLSGGSFRRRIPLLSGRPTPAPPAPRRARGSASAPWSRLSGRRPGLGSSSPGRVGRPPHLHPSARGRPPTVLLLLNAATAAAPRLSPPELSQPSRRAAILPTVL